MIEVIEIYHRLRDEVDSQVAVLEKLHKDLMAHGANIRRHLRFCSFAIHHNY